jgi:hypothetical protein
VRDVVEAAGDVGIKDVLFLLAGRREDRSDGIVR